ncbi:MerR family transcriptional regulator [Ruminococcaceae bacterium OttesenSCG-928-I18]|nr:MerR family transcriptional regulator [Ruminococcaceae bacterium OttesenSCG-928-I18]
MKIFNTFILNALGALSQKKLDIDVTERFIVEIPNQCPKRERGRQEVEYTIKQMAGLAGVSARTLRWYDEIGLLKPAGVSPAGYRFYGQKEVVRLQQVLFYRRAGFPLGDIKRLLDEPGYDAEREMGRHIERLYDEKRKMERLISNAEKTLMSMKGEGTMQNEDRFEGFKRERLNENEKNFGEEIRREYGEATVQASNQKWMNMSEEAYESMQATERELKEVLRQAVEDGDENDVLARKAVQLHRQWLEYTWPQYTAEAHIGLAEMYKADKRFSDYYDGFAIGAAAFLCRAIKEFAE